MTLDEYKIWEQGIVADIYKAYETLLRECDLEMTESIYDKYRFLFTKKYELLDIESYEFSELQEAIDNFVTLVEPFKNKFMFEIVEHRNIECDDYMPFVREYGFIAEWYDVVDTIPAKSIEQEIVDKLARKLNPHPLGYFTRAINCKVFDLYKLGQIDFKTMQLLTYDKCSI